jgi:hypothetical protein
MTKRPLVLAVFALTALAAIHTGPEIGAKMPDFQAVDQDGKSHTLASLFGPKGAVLVVYRSADW